MPYIQNITVPDGIPHHALSDLLESLPGFPDISGVSWKAPVAAISWSRELTQDELSSVQELINDGDALRQQVLSSQQVEGAGSNRIIKPLSWAGRSYWRVRSKSWASVSFLPVKGGSAVIVEALVSGDLYLRVVNEDGKVLGTFQGSGSRTKPRKVQVSCTNWPTDCSFVSVQARKVNYEARLYVLIIEEMGG